MLKTPTADLDVASLESADAPSELREARLVGPVVWVPELEGWLVTSRESAVTVLRDADTFTVDDERFSTGVVVGTSMLSTDGHEHDRHRRPFAAPFAGAAVQNDIVEPMTRMIERRVGVLAGHGQGELRSALAAPVAVESIVDVLGLGPVDLGEVLGWYRSIVDGVNQVSAGCPVGPATLDGLAGLRSAVERTSATPGSLVAAVAGAGEALTSDELFANIAVLMFGAIETCEGMTANALWHLLTEPGLLAEIVDEPARIAALVEESLRLEPAAAVVDRYATCDVDLDEATIQRGDFVRVSLTAANRDPAVFAEPDRFDLDRENARQHLAFVQGPHVCLGLHVARAQTAAVLAAVIDQVHDLVAVDVTAPTGLIFRKPDRLQVNWTPGPLPG